MPDEELRQSFEDAMIVHNALFAALVEAVERLGANNFRETIARTFLEVSQGPEVRPSLKRQFTQMADFINGRQRPEFNLIVIDGGKLDD